MSRILSRFCAGMAVLLLSAGLTGLAQAGMLASAKISGTGATIGTGFGAKGYFFMGWIITSRRIHHGK